MSWALSWAIVRAATGDDPSAEEVAAWWKENPRTAYREQASFRKAFPDLDTPARLFVSREAKALVNEFVASMPKGGALKQIRALEEASNPYRLHDRRSLKRTSGGERRSQEPGGARLLNQCSLGLTGSLKASPRATCGRP